MFGGQARYLLLGDWRSIRLLARRLNLTLNANDLLQGTQLGVSSPCRYLLPSCLMCLPVACFWSSVTPLWLVTPIWSCPVRHLMWRASSFPCGLILSASRTGGPASVVQVAIPTKHTFHAATLAGLSPISVQDGVQFSPSKARLVQFSRRFPLGRRGEDGALGLQRRPVGGPG